MPTFVVLLLNALTTLGLLVVASSERLARSLGAWGAGIGVLPLADGGLLWVYVFGEDDYRDTGISRWDAYRSPRGALAPMFVASVALMAACAVFLAYATVARRPHLLRGAALTGGLVAPFLVTATIIGFSTN